MRRPLAIVTTVVTAAAGLLFSAGIAHADPSAEDWAALRNCESSGRYDTDTGNTTYGAYQFKQATWEGVGGSGRPSLASPAEQDYRALYLYRMQGWRPWVCAGLLGLREDSMARSGVVPSYADSAYIGGGGEPATPPAPAESTPDPTPVDTGSSGAPAYPGHQFHEGDYSEDLMLWQKQMGSRGYPLVGTGYFGPKTKEAVLDLQRKAGLNVVGYIGPKTWAAAWGSADSSTPAAPSSGNSGYATLPTTESCSVGASTAPAWPGTTFNYGDVGRDLICWQKQMGSRGFGLVGTGYYGDATKEVVLGVQQRNGLPTSGILGPKTWAAAWEGN